MSSTLSGDRAEEVFARWRLQTDVTTLSSNLGRPLSPIQDWYRFKEAFTPELVRDAIRNSPVPVKRCVDPFSGSGTTALVCQMLGIESAAFETNPFLYDLSSAKTTEYDLTKLADDIETFKDRLSGASLPTRHLEWPPTFVEPGRTGRWIFDATVAMKIAQAVEVIDGFEREGTRQFFRVALGSLLTAHSNVVINGKGRRYRRRQQRQRPTAADLNAALTDRLSKMLLELRLFPDRFNAPVSIQHSDVRNVEEFPPFELAIFSPPYPNSFDYTDVYNLELWALGYLRNRSDDRSLRGATISSHVQLARQFSPAPSGSEMLTRTIESLDANHETLWNRRIPQMVGAYFAELSRLIDTLMMSKSRGGRIQMVLGNSRYAGIDVDTAGILSELATARGWSVVSCRPIRSMRASPQQGGQITLRETLLILE